MEVLQPRINMLGGWGFSGRDMGFTFGSMLRPQGGVSVIRPCAGLGPGALLRGGYLFEVRKKAIIKRRLLWQGVETIMGQRRADHYNGGALEDVLTWTCDVHVTTCEGAGRVSRTDRVGVSGSLSSKKNTRVDGKEGSGAGRKKSCFLLYCTRQRPKGPGCPFTHGRRIKRWKIILSNGA